MKLFASILAGLLLIISFMPCADIDAGSCQTGHDRVSHEYPGDDGDENTGDNCSPFCHCSCCTSYSVAHPLTEFQPALPGYTTDHGSFFNASLTELSFPIWQPPQLHA